jgi:hypothetical protein
VSATSGLSFALLGRTAAVAGLIIGDLLMTGCATTANVVPQTQSVVPKGIVLQVRDVKITSTEAIQSGKSIGAALLGALGTLPKDNLSKLAVGLFGGVEISRSIK